MTTQVTAIAGLPTTHIDGNTGALVGGAQPAWFISGIAYVADNHPMLNYYKLNPNAYTIATAATAPPAYLAAVAAGQADRGTNGTIGGPEIDGAGNVNTPVFPHFV